VGRFMVAVGTVARVGLRPGRAAEEGNPHAAEFMILETTGVGGGLGLGGRWALGVSARSGAVGLLAMHGIARRGIPRRRRDRPRGRRLRRGGAALVALRGGVGMAPQPGLHRPARRHPAQLGRRAPSPAPGAPASRGREPLPRRPRAAQRRHPFGRRGLSAGAGAAGLGAARAPRGLRARRIRGHPKPAPDRRHCALPGSRPVAEPARLPHRRRAFAGLRPRGLRQLRLSPPRGARGALSPTLRRQERHDRLLRSCRLGLVERGGRGGPGPRPPRDALRSQGLFRRLDRGRARRADDGGSGAAQLASAADPAVR